jgi:hypothetical protein
MRRRVLLCLTLVSMSACQGHDVASPNVEPTSLPTPVILDGSHSSGNPDFFFLPPLVRDPKTLPGGAPNPMWNAGKSNSDLTPTVRICELDAVVDSRGIVTVPVTEATPCKSARLATAYDVTTTLTAANVSRGILDDTDIDNALTRFLTHYSSFVEPYYHFGWKVPAGPVGTTKPPAFYRINVTVGKKGPLGILDIESVNNFTQLFNVKTQEFVPLTANLRVPINFRIEQYALCETPGIGPCASKTVDLTKIPATGLEISLGEASVKRGIKLFPDPAPPSTTEPAVTYVVTVSECTPFHPAGKDDFHARGVTDLPTFGPCSRVTIEPALTRPLPVPAIAFSCQVRESYVAGGVIDGAQAERIALHRLANPDADPESTAPKLEALPHEHPDCGILPPVVGAAPTLGQVYVALRDGQIRLAAARVAAMLTPKPLYAARFIDLGGGGRTVLAPVSDAAGFSKVGAKTEGGPGALGLDIPTDATINEFQFALPAKFDIIATPSDQTATPGALNLSVKVTDLAGAAVRGARVRFTGSTGTSVAPPIVESTSLEGLASVVWTIVPGVNTLTASGRGIGGVDRNGPREGVDPFQALDNHWGDPAGSDDSPVLLRTGSFTVTRRSSQRLTVTGAGDGTGTVTSTPAGIACTITAGVATGSCAADFANGSSVSLAATTSEGHGFTGWTGACSGGGACVVAMTEARNVAASFNLPPTTPGVISNGTVWFGIKPFGNLNVPNGGPPSSGTATTTLGLRYLATNADAMSPGCPCEGWGVADAVTGVTGFANASTGTANIVGETFTTTHTQVLSVVRIGSTFRVTHDFHPSAITPFLFEVVVTIENISASPVADLRYRRVMDWDVEPTAFNEYVTIQGKATTPTLAFVSDNGFAAADPLSGRGQILFTGDAIDSGPTDHGTLFDFAFGTLAVGETKTFKLYYGAAGNEADALGALRAIGAEVYSLGEPGSDRLGGTPNTFMIGFTGVGGSSIVPAPVAPLGSSRTTAPGATTTSTVEPKTGIPDPRNHP